MKRKLGILLLSFLLLSGNMAFGAQWQKDNPDIEVKYVNECFEAILDNQDAADRLLAGYRNGCEIRPSSTSTSFDVLAGEITLSNSDGSVRLMMKNSSTITTSPTVSASTQYYVYAVASATTAEVFTVEVSTSATTPSATYYKRLGSFKTDASSNVIEISNDGAIKNLSYDSGWFAVTTDTQYTKTHNLYTHKCITEVLVSNGNPGSIVESSGEVVVLNWGVAGTIINRFTDTEVTIKTGNQQINSRNLSYNDSYNITSGYARILIMKTE